MRHQPVYHDIKTTPGTSEQKHGYHRFQFYNIVSLPSDEWSRQHSKEEKCQLGAQQCCYLSGITVVTFVLSIIMDNPIGELIKNKTYKRSFYNEFNVSQVKRRTFPKICDTVFENCLFV